MNPSDVNYRRQLEQLRELCVTPNAEVSNIEAVIQTLNLAGYQNDVLSILRSSAESPTAHVEVAALWIRNNTARHHWGLSDDLNQFMARGEMGRRAVMAYVAALGAAARTKSLLAVLNDHSEWLRQDPNGWNTVTSALAGAKQSWRLLRWTSDWKFQKHASQDALYHRAAALRRLGLIFTADKIVRAALKRPKVSEKIFSKLLVWVSTQAAMAGNTADALSALRQIDTFSLDEPTARMYRLSRSVVDVQATPRAERLEVMQNSIKRIARAFKKIPVWRRDLATQQCLQQAFWRLAVDARSLRPLVWGYWRYYARVILSGIGILIGIILLPFFGVAILYMPCCSLIPICFIAYLAASKNRGAR